MAPARLVLPLVLAGLMAGQAAAAPATLILRHAEVWTMDPARPRAQAVAVVGDRIVKVGGDAEVMALKGPKTRMLDLAGGFVLPGFIDAHTHFGNAVESFFQVRLVDVNAAPLLRERLRAAAAEVPKGLWITGVDWGSAAHRRGEAVFTPTLAEVDAAAPDHPVLLRRWDGAYFANSRALALARIDATTPNSANSEYAKDPATGALTGLLLGSAGERVALMMPPPSRARDLVGARAMLRQLAAYGVTGIHDIARVDAISQTQLFPTAVERSATDLSLFQDLRARGELTVRVYPILTLATFRELKSHGIRSGSGDDMIRFGALKQFVDATWMDAPFANTPGYAGSLSFRVTDEAQVARDVADADRAGFDVAAHALGDRANRVLADWYEAAIAKNGPRDRRFRFIHAWYPAPREVARAGRMHAIADITPSQLVSELDGMETHLGPERAAYAFPWRSLIDHGVRLDIGSDWPGSFDRNTVYPVNPMVNIYYAVTRQRLDGTPAGGWHPEQALTVDEALAAYTINPAYAAHEERMKGSLTPGKLADLVVLDRDIRKASPREILATKVRLTILGGKVIYRAPVATAPAAAARPGTP